MSPRPTRCAVLGTAGDVLAGAASPAHVAVSNALGNARALDLVRAGER
jgi:hypothetical protein